MSLRGKNVAQGQECRSFLAKGGNSFAPQNSLQLTKCPFLVSRSFQGQGRGTDFIPRPPKQFATDKGQIDHSRSFQGQGRGKFATDKGQIDHSRSFQGQGRGKNLF